MNVLLAREVLFCFFLICGACLMRTFRPLAPEDGAALLSALSFLPLESSSLHKVLDPRFQTLAARPLQQGAIVALSGSFHEATLHNLCFICGSNMKLDLFLLISSHCMLLNTYTHTHTHQCLCSAGRGSCCAAPEL